MRKKLILTGGFILVLMISFWRQIQYGYFDFQEYLTLRDKIIWSENNQLDWEDFIYAPDQNYMDNILTDVGIAARYHIGDSQIEYRSTTAFVPSKSFVSDTTNPTALRIANVRFNLCEVYRRKLESKIKVLKTTDVEDVPLDTLKNQHKIFIDQFEKEWDTFLDVPENLVEKELLELEKRVSIELKKSY